MSAKKMDYDVVTADSVTKEEKGYSIKRSDGWTFYLSTEQLAGPHQEGDGRQRIRSPRRT